LTVVKCPIFFVQAMKWPLLGNSYRELKSLPRNEALGIALGIALGTL
jgi:hypothetical protein